MNKIKRPCRNALCSNLTSSKSGYCKKHSSTVKDNAKRYDSNRGSAQDRGYGSHWQALSKAFKRSHPICHDCGRVAELVHHVKPIAQGGEVLDEDNLRSLCKACHDRVHVRIERGGASIL